MSTEPDVVLIGAGIMSATVGMLLKELEPSLGVTLFEGLEGPALESTDAWNNAGTGHAANCELNYTPERDDGSIDIDKALDVNTQFDVSRQLWAHLARTGALEPSFIHAVPHMSFVRGEDNVALLRKRFEVIAAHHCFVGMEYSEDRRKIAAWAPLIIEGRDDEPVAATYIATGTDIDYGALTRQLLRHLSTMAGFAAHYRHRVTDLQRQTDGRWRVEVSDNDGRDRSVVAKRVFIGAGGGALALLEKSGIPEAQGYGGFPVSGIWLRCDDQALAARHGAKVYGRASAGSPPMSVPHLDVRVIGGARSLLFGPYAGFSTKFLKHGSYLDLFESLVPSNFRPMLSVARDNFDLTKYLLEQVVQTDEERFAALREFFPRANVDDWTLQIAGQRVQIIKPHAERGGTLQFGTELVAASDGSLVALLGASPGASTAAHIAVCLVERCFAGELGGWSARLRKIIPSYGTSLVDDAALCARLRAETAAALKLQ